MMIHLSTKTKHGEEEEGNGVSSERRKEEEKKERKKDTKKVRKKTKTESQMQTFSSVNSICGLLVNRVFE